MSLILEPSVFFANLKPDPEERKLLMIRLSIALFGPKTSTVYISGPGNTGKTALISLIQKITDMVSLPMPLSHSLPTNDFIWMRNTGKPYQHSLKFSSFNKPKVFVFCSDEFPLVKDRPQVGIELDRVFGSDTQPIDFSNHKDYEEYIKNYFNY